MNTYAKYCPNVYCAKCDQQYQKGETITVTTQYGKEHECIVFNLLLERNGVYYYSVVRADGFNVQEWAKRRAERLNGYATNAAAKSEYYWKASNKNRDFLSLAEPIKIGHHSERKHRRIIEQADNNMGKSVQFAEKAKEYTDRIKYWESKANTINLSMPESIEYYEFKLEQAKAKHEGLKNGSIPREHSYSLTYAKKEVNEMTKNLETAKKLWA